MAPSLRDSVTHYIDHIQEAAWVEALVGEHGLAQVLQCCADVLTERKPSEVGHVTTFLLDIGRPGAMMKDEFVAQVGALMPAAALPALRSLLQAPDLVMRMDAIHTIGRLPFATEGKTLRDAFSSCLDRDPLCLPRLLSELDRRGDWRGVAARVKRVMAHEHYLVRWSGLGYLGNLPATRWPRLRAGWLATLSQDPAPLVAAEARYQRAELDMEIAGKKAEWWPKVEWRNKRRALEKARPSLTFFDLEIQFQHDMTRRGQARYTIEELDTFVRGR